MSSGSTEDQIQTEQHAKFRAQEFLHRATETGKWMVVVLRVDEDGVVHRDRVTWQFPVDAAPKALEMVTEDLQSLTPVPDHPQLDFANWLKDVEKGRVGRRSDADSDQPL